MTTGDGDLVRAHLAGDTAAFAAIYDRYADRIFTYCASMLRNRHDATDAAQDTFVAAATRLGQLRDPDRLRPWLFAIARNESTNRLRRRAREQPEDSFEDLVADDTDPARTMEASETGALLWDAAGSLQPRDRELLELHIRNGLEGADLAEAMGMTPAHVSTLLHRAKERIGTAVGSMLVARYGREACPALDGLLASWDGGFSLEVRSTVTRHIRGCAQCRATEADRTSPARFAAALPLLPAPLALRPAVLAAAGPTGVAAGTAAPSAAVATASGATVGKVVAAVLGVLVVAGGVGAVVVSRADDDGPGQVASAPAPDPTDPPVSTTSSTAAPTTTATEAPVTSLGPDPAADPLGVAQATWAAQAGRPYLLVMDIDSEGLFGIYCVTGVAGDASQTVDVSGQASAGATCQDDGQTFFGEPADVEVLLGWAAQALAVGGEVAFDERGVPVSVVQPPSGAGDGGLRVTVVDVAFLDE